MRPLLLAMMIGYTVKAHLFGANSVQKDHLDQHLKELKAAFPILPKFEHACTDVPQRKGVEFQTATDVDALSLWIKEYARRNTSDPLWNLRSPNLRYMNRYRHPTHPGKQAWRVFVEHLTTPQMSETPASLKIRNEELCLTSTGAAIPNPENFFELLGKKMGYFLSTWNGIRPDGSWCDFGLRPSSELLQRAFKLLDRQLPKQFKLQFGFWDESWYLSRKQWTLKRLPENVLGSNLVSSKDFLRNYHYLHQFIENGRVPLAPYGYLHEHDLLQHLPTLFFHPGVLMELRQDLGKVLKGFDALPVQSVDQQRLLAKMTRQLTIYVDDLTANNQTLVANLLEVLISAKKEGFMLGQPKNEINNFVNARHRANVGESVISVYSSNTFFGAGRRDPKRTCIDGACSPIALIDTMLYTRNLRWPSVEIKQEEIEAFTSFRDILARNEELTQISPKLISLFSNPDRLGAETLRYRQALEEATILATEQNSKNIGQ